MNFWDKQKISEKFHTCYGLVHLGPQSPGHTLSFPLNRYGRKIKEIKRKITENTEKVFLQNKIHLPNFWGPFTFG